MDRFVYRRRPDDGSDRTEKKDHKKKSFVEAAEHGREEHAENKEMLAKLDDMAVTDEGYDTLVHKMMQVQPRLPYSRDILLNIKMTALVLDV